MPMGVVTMIVIVCVTMFVVVRVTMIVIVRVTVVVRVPVVVLVIYRLHAWSHGHAGLRLRVQALAEEEHQRRSQQRK